MPKKRVKAKPRRMHLRKKRVKAKPRRMHLRKNDLVHVVAGDDLGKTGRVLRVFAGSGRVLVEGINLIKRHTRANPRQNIKGGVVEREAPIAFSNVMIVDPETNRPTRIRRTRLTDGRRVRISVRSEGVIDK